MNEWYQTEAERIAAGFSPANGTDADKPQDKTKQHATGALQTFLEHDAVFAPPKQVNAIVRGFEVLAKLVK